MSLRDSVRFVVTHPINQRRLSRGMFDWLGWQAWSRLRKGPHARPWIGGTRLWARRGETGITGNLYAGLHEFEDMAFALHVLRPGDLFVDVGANAGAYSVLAGGAVGCRVLAVEALASTFDRLQANIALNSLGKRVRAVNVAVGAQPGRVAFTASHDTVNHVVAAAEESGACEFVDVCRLDDLLGDEAPELVKIDVEGFEHAVVEGGPRCFSASGAHGVLVELNGSGSRYGWSDERVAEQLFSAGYRTFRYDPFTRQLDGCGREVRTSGNTLFIRDAARAAARVREAPRFRVKGVWL